jgi:hypothetical protein
LLGTRSARERGHGDGAGYRKKRGANVCALHVRGILKVIPARRYTKLVFFAWLAERFDLESRYLEAEVNRMLGKAHADIATLRRGLYDEHFAALQIEQRRRISRPSLRLLRRPMRTD